ncbi:MAG TPA: rod shape-determining protein MreC [Candidatus Acidoferrum sp.]|nr:rod shape-determining protein MreC [Candidatus Acidoferrum sp.]
MKRRHYIAFAIVIVLTVVVMKLPPRVATQFKLAMGSMFLPLFGLSSSTQQIAEKTGNAVVPRGELLAQNEQIRRENAELRVQLQRQSEFERENERLRAMLAFQKTSPWKIRAARVIARDPANWWRNVQIDLGKRDGLRPDAAVLTSDGLVGRVSEVSDTRARVVLIGDANCRVAASVLDTPLAIRGKAETITIDNGVITTGSSVLDESIVELGFLSKTSQVKPGQEVRTSGLGGIFPKGILIGQVIDTRPVEFGLYTVARVKLAMKMNLLDEVWVMMP